MADWLRVAVKVVETCSTPPKNTLTVYLTHTAIEP
jgi:hypothetical protein